MNEKAFDISDDSAVVTSTYVVNEKLPILYVSHEFDEEDGSNWQFHCGNEDYDMSKMLLVSLKNILKIDESISGVSNLPIGYVARRKFIGDRWVYSEE